MSHLSDLIDAPIILFGRGGSGTRLLSKILQGMSLFLGNELNDSQDSEEWIDIIYDLVVNKKTIKNKTFGEEEVSALRLNAKRVLMKQGEKNIKLWGFKLPEIMLCMPELKKAFPKARFVHLVRHPMTINLRRTHLTSRLDNPIGKVVLKQAYSEMGKSFLEVEKTSDDINNAISWVYQLRQVLQFAKSSLNESSYMVVKYEDICKSADKVKNSIFKFIDSSYLSNHQSDLIIDFCRIKMYNSENTHIDGVWEICAEIAGILNYSQHEIMR